MSGEVRVEIKLTDLQQAAVAYRHAQEEWLQSAQRLETAREEVKLAEQAYNVNRQKLQQAQNELLAAAIV